jgi:hypothetical protein
MPLIVALPSKILHDHSCLTGAQGFTQALADP